MDRITKYYIACALPVLIDMFFSALGIRRAIRGRGASGIPLVTLILYAILIWDADFVSLPIKCFLSAIAIVVHFILLFGLPMLIGYLRARLN